VQLQRITIVLNEATDLRDAEVRGGTRVRAPAPALSDKKPSCPPAAHNLPTFAITQGYRVSFAAGGLWVAAVLAGETEQG